MCERDNCAYSHCLIFFFQSDAKDAAKTLGYNKKTWDNDKDPETFGYDWAELDDEQKKAAVVIGYDEVTWDKE